LRNNI